MKKILIVALATVLFSCSSHQHVEQKPINVSVTMDTTIRMPQWRMHTAPRYSCSGQRLSHDKLLSFDTSSQLVPISLTATKTIVVPCGTTDSVTASHHKENFFPDWLMTVLGWLLKLFLLVLVGWLLWEVFSWMYTNTHPIRANRSGGFTAMTTGNQLASSVSTENIGGQVKTNASSSRLAELTALVAALGAAGGGEIQDGDLQISIATSSPLVSIHVENSGTNSHSGDISIS